MAKRNTLRQKYYKETGLHWKRFGKLEAKPTTEYCKWLENELLTEMEQVKKLNIDDVSKCYTEKDMDNAYDKGFKDGNQRDLTGSLIEVL